MAGTVKKAGTTLAAGALATGVLAVRDYRQWQALGEGGIPWGLRGWLTMSKLRLRQGDPFAVAHFSRGQEHPEMAGLPTRRDPRPRIAPHPVPHRQLDQDASPAMLDALGLLFDAERVRFGDAVEERNSEFEKHHPALFAPDLVRRELSPHGEVAHFHRPQGSMHLLLNPLDARTVIERGWGELHGLSGMLVPASYALLYAPRTEDELDAVRSILRATLEWATGRSATDEDS